MHFHVEDKVKWRESGIAFLLAAEWRMREEGDACCAAATIHAASFHTYHRSM